ncbi:MAG: hypothetical protein OXI67_08245 [Candidatus Poribacteria bacterium]|nr:hypothetical protein [Candidatus Poribacteria bacterium]
MVKGFFKRALNPKKGPFRLTLVLSIIIGGYLGNEAAKLQDRSYDGWFDFLTWFLGGRYGSIYYALNFQLGKFMAVFIGTSAIIWSIYFIIYWIAVGFTNKE